MLYFQSVFALRVFKVIIFLWAYFRSPCIISHHKNVNVTKVYSTGKEGSIMCVEENICRLLNMNLSTIMIWEYIKVNKYWIYEFPWIRGTWRKLSLPNYDVSSKCFVHTQPGVCSSLVIKKIQWRWIIYNTWMHM